MYIAHHLLTLGHQFRPKLPEPLNQSVASFVDLVPTIRQMGEKCFLEQLVSISNVISPSVWNILAHVTSDCQVNTSTDMTSIFLLQRKQKSNLLEILKATQGFANAHEDEKGLQIERTMKQVGRARDCWPSSFSVYVQAKSHVLTGFEILQCSHTVTHWRRQGQCCLLCPSGSISTAKAILICIDLQLPLNCRHIIGIFLFFFSNSWYLHGTK